MTAGTPEPGRYACPLCKRRFEFLADKKRHVKFTHAPKGGAR